MKLPENKEGLKIKKIIIYSLVLFTSILVIFLIGFGIYSSVIAINDTVVQGEKYGFKIRDSKKNILKIIKNQYFKNMLDDVSLDYFRQNFSIDESRKIYLYFDRWRISLDQKSYLLKFNQDDQVYEIKQNGIKPSNLPISIGEKKDVVFSILSGGKKNRRIIFKFFNADIYNFDPNLIEYSGDIWDIGYSTKYGIDYLRLIFENDKLVEMKRRRQLIETP